MAGAALFIDAVLNGDIEGVRRQIADGADVRARTDDGSTALHCAASRGHREVCELLLDNGADVNGCDYDGRTVLHAAASDGKPEVIDLLIRRGAFVSPPDDGERRTPLHMAAECGKADIIDLLIAAGAEVDERDGSGKTPLALASGAGHIETMEVLLSMSADPDKPDESNITPLLSALMNDQVDAARLLLSVGASFSIHEKREGLSPLHLAAARGQKEMVELLLNCGAQIDSKSISGATPADAAELAGHREIVERLHEFAQNEALILEEEYVVPADPGESPLGDAHNAHIEQGELGMRAATEDGDSLIPSFPDGHGYEPGPSSEILRFAIEPHDDEDEREQEPQSAPADRVVHESLKKAVPQEDVERRTATQSASPESVEIHERQAAAASLTQQQKQVAVRKPRRKAARARPMLALLVLISVGAITALALIAPSRFGFLWNHDLLVGFATGFSKPSAVPEATPAAPGPVSSIPPKRRVKPAEAKASARSSSSLRSEAQGKGRSAAAVTATIMSRPPGATAVIDDGLRSGKTPLVVVLKPGDHKVRVALSGYRPEHRVIRISSVPLRVFIELQPVLD